MLRVTLERWVEYQWWGGGSSNQIKSQSGVAARLEHKVIEAFEWVVRSGTDRRYFLFQIRLLTASGEKEKEGTKKNVVKLEVHSRN